MGEMLNTINPINPMNSIICVELYLYEFVNKLLELTTRVSLVFFQ
jgi:hypothetical protein